MLINHIVTTVGREAVIFLAGPQPGDPDPTNGKGAEWGKAAPFALLLVVLLGISIAFLVRSMTKHVKNLPASFDSASEPGTTAAVGSAPDATASDRLVKSQSPKPDQTS